MLGKELNEAGKGETSIGEQSSPPITPHQVKERNKRKSPETKIAIAEELSPVDILNKQVETRNLIIGYRHIGDLGGKKMKVWAMTEIAQKIGIEIPKDLIESSTCDENNNIQEE